MIFYALLNSLYLWKTDVHMMMEKIGVVYFWFFEIHVDIPFLLSLIANYYNNDFHDNYIIL